MTAIIFKNNYINQIQPDVIFEQYLYLRAHHTRCVLLYGMPINNFKLKKEGII